MEFFTERFEAIGVTNQITVLDAATLAPALSIAQTEVGALDDACSRFRDDSELARLNRDGAATVSPLLGEALAAALAVAESTDGLVDPTVGSAMRAIGYDRDFELIIRRGSPRTIERRPAMGWEAVRIDRPAATVALPAGCELDLGASAKAFAADRIATRIQAETMAAVLVSLGGDIAVAGTAPSDGWPILVTDSSRETDARGQVVSVHAGGLATSSTTVRRWRAGETELHHIIDPRSGLPARTSWRTVSVAAPSCLQANAAATAAIVLGDDAPRWLARRRLSARLVDIDGDALTIGGWPADDISRSIPSSTPEVPVP